MERKQGLALLLTAALVIQLPVAAFAETTHNADANKLATEAEKEETVFVFTDANGNEKSKTVSNWLKNIRNANVITDRSQLMEIENVKGEEVFTQDGEDIRWNANGNDIYYQGTTAKAAPVSQKITYYLDGRQVTPQELAGSSGRVTIHIDYVNEEKYQNVYVPFTAVTGIIFSNDHVHNVKVDNGSVLSEGKNTVVMGMAFPGLSDSLQVVRDNTEDALIRTDAGSDVIEKVKEVTIPDSVEITLEATDFEMSTCMTMVFSDLFDDDRESADSLLAEMDRKMMSLTEDGQKLADGAGDLSDGISEANEGTGQLSDGADKLSKGIKEYTGGVGQVNEGAGKLDNGTKKLVQSMPSLTKGLKEYTGGVSKVDKGMGTLVDSLPDLTKGTGELSKGLGQYGEGVSTLTKGLGTLHEGTSRLSGNSKALNSGVAQVAEGASQLDNGAKALSKGAAKLKKGTGQLAGSNKKITEGATALAKGAEELSKGVGKLKGGTQELADNSGALNEGAGKLSDGLVELPGGMSRISGGAIELRDGCMKLNEEGVKKLAEVYNSDVKTMDERLKELKDAARSYKTFSGTADPSSSKVKFIYKADGIVK